MTTPRKIKITLEVELDAETLIDPQTLYDEFENSYEKYVRELYKEEGHFWDEELKLVKVEEV